MGFFKSREEREAERRQRELENEQLVQARKLINFASWQLAVDEPGT